MESSRTGKNNFSVMSTDRAARFSTGKPIVCEKENGPDAACGKNSPPLLAGTTLFRRIDPGRVGTLWQLTL